MSRRTQRSRRPSPGFRLLVAILGVVVLAIALAIPNVGQITPTTPSALSGDWYEIYFTTPQPTANGQDAGRGNLDERLVEFINAAQRSVDVAIYDFDLENVAQALAAAQRRGVRVRMVTDADTVASRNEDVQHALAIVRDAGIPIVSDDRRAIMHHKFVVRDDEWVWTGSWNFTRGDTDRLNNNAAQIRSPELAENFRVEFEKMFDAREFGPRKAVTLPHPSITVDGARIDTCFASELRCDELIIDVVRSAQQSVHFLAYSYTHDGIGDAMLARYRAGVEVSGVFETTGSETEYSEYGRFAEAGLAVYQDANRYPMHHKVIVVDGKTVVFGSFNFSDAAANDNDENVLVVTHDDFAAAFEAEFARILDAARNREKRSTGSTAGEVMRRLAVLQSWARGRLL